MIVIHVEIIRKHILDIKYDVYFVYIYFDFDIYNEMNKLHKTAFLIKCLNSFSYDNLNAIKNILKK